MKLHRIAYFLFGEDLICQMINEIVYLMFKLCGRHLALEKTVSLIYDLNYQIDLRLQGQLIGDCPGGHPT